MDDSCEHCKDPSGFIKCWEVLSSSTASQEELIGKELVSLSVFGEDSWWGNSPGRGFRSVVSVCCSCWQPKTTCAASNTESLESSRLGARAVGQFSALIPSLAIFMRLSWMRVMSVCLSVSRMMSLPLLRRRETYGGCLGSAVTSHVIVVQVVGLGCHLAWREGGPWPNRATSEDVLQKGNSVAFLNNLHYNFRLHKENERRTSDLNWFKRNSWFI